MLSILKLLNVLISGITRDISGPESQETLRRFVEGDPEAVGEIFDMYHRHVYNFILKYASDQDEAEDVVQDSFLRLLKNRHRLNPEHGIRSYLFTIAVNICRDLGRRRKRIRFDSYEAINRDFDSISGSERIEKKHEFREMEERLEYHVDRLPENIRTALLLRKINGLDFGEIGEIIGSSSRTVRRLLEKGVKELARRLESEGFVREGELL